MNHIVAWVIIILFINTGDVHMMIFGIGFFVLYVIAVVGVWIEQRSCAHRWLDKFQKGNAVCRSCGKKFASTRNLRRKSSKTGD